MSVYASNDIALLYCRTIANICYLADVILAKGLVQVGTSLMKEQAGNPRDDEEVSRASLKIMQYFWKIKTLWLLVFKKL